MPIEDEQKVSALEEVTQAAFSGLIRAMRAHELELEEFPGPLLIGIWAWPALSTAGIAERVGGGRVETIGVEKEV
jgi:hypothetical protein